MTIEVLTQGCRLNAYESEVMKQLASQNSHDAVVINSCAVTAEAERQLRQMIRRTRKEKPQAKIVVTGCAAQISPDIYAAMDEVDLVVGNEEKMQPQTWGDLWEAVDGKRDAGSEASRPSPLVARSALGSSRDSEQSVESRTQPVVPRGSADKNIPATESLRDSTPPQGGNGFIGHSEKIRVNDIMSVEETAGHLIAGFEGQTRAFVQVQNGCNHRCTFCIIPYGRGNSRSVPMGEVVAQVRTLVESGYKEVVLTGVDISDYGKDLPGEPTLGAVCEKILKAVPELPRLRLSSIDAVEIDDVLWKLVAEEPRLMPHLHLSLQAGDDMVLKRMKRRHLRGDIVAFCKQARDLRPDIVFGADIIAGFPTESDVMFENTLQLVDEVALTWLHVFPYSERESTPAARMPQVEKPIRKERAGRLREAGEKQAKLFMCSQVGKVQNVLVEKDYVGRTEHFAPVKVAAEEGMLVHVTPNSIENRKLAV